MYVVVFLQIFGPLSMLPMKGISLIRCVGDDGSTSRADLWLSDRRMTYTQSVLKNGETNHQPIRPRKCVFVLICANLHQKTHTHTHSSQTVNSSNTHTISAEIYLSGTGTYACTRCADYTSVSVHRCNNSHMCLHNCQSTRLVIF